MRKLHVINTGFFKLDGGAMFGVVPKVLWQKTNPADEQNLCTWAMRCLLVEDGDRKILIDNGIGNKQDAKFLAHYHLHGSDNLFTSLSRAGCSPEAVTDNILTHLHFDHCGGSLCYTDDTRTTTATSFPNARYWVHSGQWAWAMQPNAREKASFLKENLLPLEASNQLFFLDQQPNAFSGIDFFYADGHTEKQAIPLIRYKDKTIVFIADLLPSTGHIPLPYVMGYDTRPLLTMAEKQKFLTRAAEEQYILFLEHDPVHECCTLQITDKGVRLKEAFNLADIL